MKRFSLLFLLVVAPLIYSSAQSPRTLTVTRDLLVASAEADLSETFSMTVSRRGEILVSQPEDGHIKVFSPTGAVTIVGRSGEGPGEFKRVTRIGFIGDSLWALDPNTARVTFFGPDYKLLRSFAEPFSAMKAMQSKASDQPVVQFFIQAVLPGGALRAIASMRQGAPKPSWAADIDSGATLFVRISSAGEFQRRLAVAPVSPCSIEYSVGKGRGATRIPYCPDRMSTDWNGSVGLAFVDVLGSKGRSAKYRVTLIRETGDTAFARIFPFVPIPITQGARDSVESQRAKQAKQLPPAFAAAMPRPDPEPTYPPVRNVLLGRDNTVWLEMRTSTGGHRWLVLDQQGTPVGTILLPDEITLKVADRGMLWGLTTDEDGLQGIVRYKVGK